jgi:enoyl-CoA hydratase
LELLFEKQGAIALVTINREKAFNALNAQVMDGLDQAFAEVERDAAIRVVIISGAGPKAFVAGADLKEIKQAGLGRPALIRRGLDTFGRVRDCSKVVIAAVNGLALGGGCELALSCDLRFASQKARFALPEATLGLMPGYGGTQLLPRLVGEGRAKLMAFSGEMIGADEALRIGLVERVHPPEELLARTREYAQKVAGNGPLALKAIKTAINQGRGLTPELALEIEQREYGRVAISKDAESGLDAFMEKRSPEFIGE